MRRTSVIVIGLLVAAAARPAAAQEMKGTVEFSLFAGGLRWDLPGVKDGPMAGLRLGYNATENLELEAFVDRSRPSVDSCCHVEGTTYGVDVLWNQRPGDRAPGLYVLAGAGWGAGDYAELSFWDFGGGYRWRLFDAVSLRLDARVFPTDDRGKFGVDRFHYKVSLGLSATL